MSVRIITTVSKKVPIMGRDYSSVSASCTVECEITDLATVPEQARLLYQQVEAAVDEQLRLGTMTPTRSQPAPAALVASSHAGPNSAPRSSVPTPSNGRSGRGMPRASASQLKLIERLIEGDGQRASDICNQQGVRSLPELTIRAASTVIDKLRAEVPA